MIKLNKIKRIVSRLKNIDFLAFIRYNYLGKNAVINGKGLVFPYKKSVLILDKNARINLEGNLVMNGNALTQNGRSTILRMDEGAQLVVKKSFSIYYGGDVIVFAGGKLELGSGFFNSNVRIRCKESIKIGERVTIAHDVTIMDYDGHYLTEDNHQISKPIVIEDGAWICTRATILKGVTIGSGAVVAAGALVTKDVPANTIVAGVPSKVIKKDVSRK